MATRTSSRQIAAREQARERAAAYAARERELVELAEEFFVADSEAGDILEAAEARIATIRQQAERDVVATRAKAAEVAERMLATGTPAPQVADRLGMTGAELRKVRAVAGKGAGTDDHSAGDVDVDVVTEAETESTPASKTARSDVAADGVEQSSSAEQARVGALVG